MKYSERVQVIKAVGEFSLKAEIPIEIELQFSHLHGNGCAPVFVGGIGSAFYGNRHRLVGLARFIAFGLAGIERENAYNRN